MWRPVGVTFTMTGVQVIEPFLLSVDVNSVEMARLSHILFVVLFSLALDFSICETKNNEVSFVKKSPRNPKGRHQ